MTNWKEHKLGEIASINMGQSPKSNTYNNEEIGLPFFQGNRTFGRIYPTIDTYCSSPLKIAEKNDVLFSVRAPVGDINYSPEKVCIGRGLCSIRSKSGNQNFLFYLLNYIKQEIINKESGTVFGSVNKNTLENIRVFIPDLPAQTAIAEILSSLDDKIELNNKINQELENLAQTLFKQWFIDFEFPNENGEPYKSSGGEMVDSELGKIPKGWEVKRIDELDLYISDLVANGSFASIKENVQTTDNEDFALFIRNTDLKNRFKTQKLFVNKHSYDFLKKTELFGGEIILPNVGDVGSVHRCPKFNFPMTLGNNCIMVKSDTKQNWLYTFFRSSIGFHSLRSVVVGSVQDKLSKTNFKSIRIVIPNNNVLSIVENALSAIYDLQESNLKESDEYEILRDTILPKLISGGLEVADLMAEKA